MTLAAAGLAANAASAAVLWDQSVPDTSPTGVGLVNTYSPGFNGSIAYGVNNVVVPASGWTVQSVSVYFSNFNDPGTSGILNIFPKSGSLPLAGNNPQASPTGAGTPVSLGSIDFVYDNQGIREYTASGLNIVLAPGEYWIGLTPVQAAGFFGADNQWSTVNPIGVGTAVRLYGPDSGWANYGGLAGASASLDGAMKINGTATPAPSGAMLLALGGLIGARRRR
jgi:hypothetical protein